METRNHIQSPVARAETDSLQNDTGLTAAGVVGFAGRTPFQVLLESLEKGMNEEEKLLQRAAARVGEALLLAVEVFLLGGILWLKQFQPLVTAGILLWAGVRVLGLRQRGRARRRYRESFERGLTSLRARDFAVAASAFGEAMDQSRQEEAALGHAYSLGLAGHKDALLCAVRRLFRTHLYRRRPEEILQTEAYQAFLAEPAFSGMRTRIRDVLVGEVEELLHLIPGVLRRRVVQIVIGLVSFTLLALLLTSALTFL